jgi:hypothetical protein
MKKQTLKKLCIPKKIISCIDAEFGCIYLRSVHFLYVFKLLLLHSDEFPYPWNHRRNETITATILCLPEMLLSTYW